MLASSGRGSSRITAGIPTNTNTIRENTEMARNTAALYERSLPDGLGTFDGGAHAGLDVVVVTLVFMLLLTPDQVSVGIFLSLSFHQVKRERRELGQEKTEGL